MKIKSNVSHLISISFLFFISIVIAFLNFKKGYYLIGGDVGTSQIFPEEALSQSIFMWQARFAPGSSHLGWNLPAIFPYLSFLNILLKMGFSRVIIQRVYFFMLLFISGLSMYCLLIATLEYKNSIEKSLAVFFGAIFYMLNHYTMVMFSSALSNYSLSYVWAPLLLAWFIKGLNKGGDIRIYFIIGLISVMCWTTTNLAQMGVVILLLCGYLFYYMLMRKEFFKLIKCFVLIMGICILFNSWWLLPYLNIIPTGLEAVESWNAQRWLGWMSERSSILNLFRLDGYTGWIKDFPYAIAYNTYPILIIFGYFITLLAFSILLFRKYNEKILYFSGVALFGIFLAKGIHPPLGRIYNLAFKYIPGFQIYRSPYDKFSPIIAIGYAWLAAIAAIRIYDFLSKRNKGVFSSIFLLSIIGIIGIYPLPFWKGSVVRTTVDAKPSFWVKIPREYYEMASWINSQKEDFKILILPPQSPEYLNYSWGYFGDNICRNLVKKPIFTDPGLIRHAFLACSIGDYGLINLMRLYNAKYILLDEYVKTDADIKDVLINQKGMKLIRQWGGLSVYSFDENYFLPHIYATSKFTNVYGNKEGMQLLANILDVGESPFFVLDIKGCKPKVNEDFVYIWNNKAGERCFYIPADDEYIIYAVLNLHLSKKKIKSGPRIKWNKDNIDEWDILDNNINHNCNFDADNLIIDAYFDGDGKEDEFLQIKGNTDVDIMKYPWIELEYKIEDKLIQTVELVIGIDISGDNVPDGYVRGLYPYPASEKYSRYRYNIYNRARELFPEVKTYRAVTIEIYPHKLWGIDCSKDRKRWCRYWLKHIEFCDLSNEEYLMTKNGDTMDSSASGFNEEIFELDGKPYRFFTNFKYGRIENRIFHNKIYLNKGEHCLKLKEACNFDAGWIIIKKNKGKDRESILSEINFRMVNPTKYIVDIEPQDKPFGLVFSESFSPGWVAYVINNRKTVLCVHYVVNGYANGWWIDPKKFQIPNSKFQNKKNLRITIEYKPQKFVWIGFIISGISLGIIGFLSIFWRNRHG